MEDTDLYLRSSSLFSSSSIHSHDDNNGAGRELTDRNALSRYSQTWTVVAQENDGADPIIQTTMEMDWVNFRNSAYKSIGKGSVDDYEVTSVSGLENDGSTALSGLPHEVWERDGYVFVTWYMNMDEDSDSSQPITFIIVYHIKNKIEKGCTRAYCTEHSCTSTADDASLMQDYCIQWFHAEWANQFKIPVANVSYSFTLPQQSEYIASSLRFEEFTDNNNPYRDGCSISTPTANNQTSIFVDCANLNPLSEVSPQRPTFQWYVNDTERVLVPRCRESCEGGEGTNPYILLIIIGAIIGGCLWLVLFGCYCYYRKCGKNNTQLELNEPVTIGRINRNQQNKTPVSASVVWNSSGDEIMVPPSAPTPARAPSARKWNETPIPVATPILFSK